MLKRKFRLPKERLRAKKSLNFRDFVLKTSENNLGLSRFGFVVSKKIDKRAVARNKAKRFFRAYIEENLEKIKPGYDFLFILKRIPEKETIIQIKEVFIKEGYLK